jgi:phosphoglycolate phosphatase
MESEKLVMFDFDGVIADSWCVQKRAFADALLAHGLDQFATSGTFRDMLESNWFDSLREAGVAAHVVADIEEAFESAPTPDLFPGMAEVIERLAEAHPVVVITSSSTEHVRRILDEHQVRGVAEVVGGDVEPSKTLKIRAARRRYGEALEPWYVCDTVGDVAEARAAGATVVGASWGWHGEERLLRADPDLIARHPSDLLDLL